MKNFHFRWVPHQSMDDLQHVRVAKCGELLCVLEAMQRTHFRHIITGNESWFYLEYQHASQWPISRDEVLQRVDPAIGTAKIMLTIIWGVNGFHLLDLMPLQCRFDAQYFVEHVMAPLVQTVFPQGRTRYTPRLNVRLENCPIHFSKVAEQFFIEDQLLHVPHPPYSPDLARSDFWLFGRIETGLAG
jgi:histone-lysine N-methyltransferase SETMAR